MKEENSIASIRIIALPKVSKKRCEQEGLKAQVKSIKGDYADYYYYDVNVTIEL